VSLALTRSPFPVGLVYAIDLLGAALGCAAVVGILDTDCDPSVVDIVIPGNDDALKSVRLLVDRLATAVEEGSANRREQVAAAGGDRSSDTPVGDEPRPTRNQRAQDLRTRRAPQASRSPLPRRSGAEAGVAPAGAAGAPGAARPVRRGPARVSRASRPRPSASSRQQPRPGPSQPRTPADQCEDGVGPARTRRGPDGMQSAPSRPPTATKSRQHLRKAGLKNADKRAGRGRAAWPPRRGLRRGRLRADLRDRLRPADRRLHGPARNSRSGFDRVPARRRCSGRSTAAPSRPSGASGKCGGIEVPQALPRERSPSSAAIHFDQDSGFASLTTDAPVEKIRSSSTARPAHRVRSPIASPRQIPADVVDASRSLESEEVLAKPAERREAIVLGKINKYYGTIALEEQPWYLDNAITVKKMLADTLGAGAKIEAFALFALGA
jgi:hypothetical protein